MNVVTADSSPDGIAARSSHRPRRGQVIGWERSTTSVTAVAARLRRHGQDLGRRDSEQGDEQAIADHPDRALLGKPERRLDEQRVGQQGEQRPAVAECIEPVRVAAAIAGPDGLEPARDQRRGRRQHERRQPDEQEQDPDEVDDRGDRGVAQIGDDGRADEQADQGQTGEEEVERRTRDPQPGDRQVTVGVAREQDRLEEEQHGRPHGRRPAEDRQDETADERLHAEQQERRQADGHGEERGRGDRGRARDRCRWSSGSSGGRHGRHGAAVGLSCRLGRSSPSTVRRLVCRTADAGGSTRGAVGRR